MVISKLFMPNIYIISLFISTQTIILKFHCMFHNTELLFLMSYGMDSHNRLLMSFKLCYMMLHLKLIQPNRRLRAYVRGPFSCKSIGFTGYPELRG